MSSNGQPYFSLMEYCFQVQEYSITTTESLYCIFAAVYFKREAEEKDLFLLIM